MKTFKFKCELLTDVILNTKAATASPNQTLDFIPGSNFLGVVASSLYKNLSPEDSLLLFHSGKVRFGDAHPSDAGVRSLKVPSTMYYPKLGKPEEELYISNLVPDNIDLTSKQLKQCRSGFYSFPHSETGEIGKEVYATRIKTPSNFAIKSAYDRESRRSKDEQLFGYQSLGKGLSLYFSIEIDDTGLSETDVEKLSHRILDAIIGTKRIGRSRTAQYGLVSIKESDFKEIESGMPYKGADGAYATVYADSRLIFIDEYGQSTFQPTAGQLGLDGEVEWDKSQIRTFRYSPWNFKRQSFDTDRCGIEKGSVLVVKLRSKPSKFTSQYVGSYNNEGFGRIIYNPSFLLADNTGKALCKLQDKESNDEKEIFKSTKSVDTTLLRYLKMQKQLQSGEIHKKVNDWIRQNSYRFRGEQFSSQWGNIRSIAMGSSDFESFKKQLFDKDYGYLTHGVAKERWEEKDRLNRLKEFVGSLDSQFYKHIMVNLAAEMAKNEDQVCQ